ncbi:MAG: glutamate--tRNA ligase [Pseudomonadota bacterium]
MTVTRFAPSPTGFLHLGNLRAALFNWALARQAYAASGAGRFILRLDDTDAARSTQEFADAIVEDLAWLGLTPDETVRQSDRLSRYAAAADALRAAGRLYPCWETPEELDFRRKAQRLQGKPPVYDRAALRLTEAEKAALEAERPPHWRFSLDPEAIAWTDAIEGPKRIDPSAVSDPVLIREDGQVLYTLASAVDDGEMEITDVVRGADHVTNTAAQIQIMQALGHRPPRFAHHSLVTGPDGAPFSKRDAAVSLRGLRAEGLEPQALLSLVARLGSSDPVEPFETPAQVAAAFDISRFGAAPIKLDPADLEPLSARLLRARPYAEVAEGLGELGADPQTAEALWVAISPNLDRLSDAAEWIALTRDGAAPKIAPEDAAFVRAALALLPPRPWDGSTWSAWTAAAKAAAAEAGAPRKGRALFLPLRRALTGRDAGPEMGALMPLLTQAPKPEDVPVEAPDDAPDPASA